MLNLMRMRTNNRGHEMAGLKQDKEVEFKVIQLHKNKILGIGSCEKVCQAECDGLLCAAKLYDENLFDPNLQHRLPQ